MYKFFDVFLMKNEKKKKRKKSKNNYHALSNKSTQFESGNPAYLR